MDQTNTKLVEKVTVVSDGVVKIETTVPEQIIPASVNTKEINVARLLSERDGLVALVNQEVGNTINRIREIDADLQTAVDAGDPVAMKIDLQALPLN